MSMRAEIHDALDEALPPAPDLEFRVTRLLIDRAQGAKDVVRRPGRTRWTMPLRGVGGLVAAALVVLLIGGLIVGGHVWLEQRTQPQTINHINVAELKKLESRPLLKLPVIQPGSCPTSPVTDVSAHSADGFVFGAGPVYLTPTASSSGTTDWGTWTPLGLVVDTKVAGPILIRARDLETGETVLFARYPLHAIDDPGDGIPAGKMLGNQILEGENEQTYAELVIDTSRRWVGTNTGTCPINMVNMVYPKKATGCLGFQIDGTNIDGTNFTEWVVVSG
jgi:hypothetical protein